MLTTSSLSSPAVPSTTLVSVKKTNEELLQIQLPGNWQDVMKTTTSARRGSHWAWSGLEGGLIVKIDDVSHITIVPVIPNAAN